jgi:threonine/homoserine/homoserine lactone efflux protein
VDVASLVTLLLLALALAVQPWSVLAAVLLVTSEGGVAKTMAYVAGWVLALAAVAAATIALYPETPQAAASAAWTSWVEIAAGIALGGWLLLRSRRRDASEPEAPPSSSQPPGSQPKWMARLDSMSLFPAFVLGAFLPNYAIVVAAVGDVVQAGLSRTQAAVVLILFIAVASAGVAAPLLLLVFRRQDAPRIYGTWRVWLIANGQRVLTVVLVVVAVLLVGKGVIGLLT